VPTNGEIDIITAFLTRLQTVSSFSLCTSRRIGAKALSLLYSANTGCGSVKWVLLSLSPVLKQTGLEADHLLVFVAEVKNEWG
jgi:hypothetical protein